MLSNPYLSSESESRVKTDYNAVGVPISSTIASHSLLDNIISHMRIGISDDIHSNQITTSTNANNTPSISLSNTNYYRSSTVARSEGRKKRRQREQLRDGSCSDWRARLGEMLESHQAHAVCLVIIFVDVALVLCEVGSFVYG